MGAPSTLRGFWQLKLTSNLAEDRNKQHRLRSSVPSCILRAQEELLYRVCAHRRSRNESLRCVLEQSLTRNASLAAAPLRPPHPLFHFGMTGAFTVKGEKRHKFVKFTVDEKWPPRFAKLELQVWIRLVLFKCLNVRLFAAAWYDSYRFQAKWLQR